MRQITLDEVVSLLEENNNFLILTHKSPDGDTLGGSLALFFALKKCNKKARVIYQEKCSTKLKYLFENYKGDYFKEQFIISVDVAAPILFEDKCSKYDGKINLCIDHHRENRVGAENKYVDAGAAAVCEIIYDIIEKLDVKIDKDIANAIYTGIATDTGCFRYPNTTEKTHEVAMKVMGKADWVKINNDNFEIKTKSYIKMERFMYETMEFYAGGKCAISFLSKSMQDAAGVSVDEMEGLPSIPKNIEGVLMGITIKEKDEGYKISVRTQQGVDANEFCKKFDGGGHDTAAGCLIKGHIDSVKYALIKEAEEYL